MRVELIKPHEHGGTEYPAGHKLDLPNETAAWLISIGTAKTATKTATTAKPKQGDKQ